MATKAPETKSPDLKVIVLNFSGNVGKTTVTTHLLAPRIPDAHVVSIETINSGDESDVKVRGKEFGQLQEDLQSVDSAIIDVGASNIEDVIKLMSQYNGSHEDFDFFIVPVVPKEKQQIDTISTIKALAKLGVPAQKIRVVFNMVDPSEDPVQLFSGIRAFHDKEKKFTLSPDAVIHTNEIFAKLKTSKLTIADVLNDGTDYKAQIKAAKSPEEKARFAELLSVKRLASGVVSEFDAVFAALLK